MLSPKLTKEISDFIDTECRDLSVIKDGNGQLCRQCWRHIRSVDPKKEPERREILEQFTILNEELSDTVWSLLRAGKILGTLPIHRWQITVYHHVFAMSRNDDIRKNWLAGWHLKDDSLRKFMRGQRHDNRAYDDNYTDYHSLSECLHLKRAQVPLLDALSTSSELTPLMNHSIRRMLFFDIENSARILLVNLELLQEISEMSGETEDIRRKWASLQSKIIDLKKSFAEIESKQGWGS